MFKGNESRLDQQIRIGIAIISLLLGIFVFTGTPQLIALLVSVVAAITGFTGFCALYKLLGISTKK
jgi:uncharacterized protein YqhQ